MKVELLARHFIGDRIYPVETVIELPPGYRPTPLMLGLDDEAIEAIRQVKVEVFGRWIFENGQWRLLDDPPIERPIDDNQPVPPIPQGGPR